ncbi:MAG TPA: SMP-30/gluconolactonase/LRE family protein [Mycobacteriales bacterium]
MEEPRAVSAEVAELGEGARWDAGRAELVWVDILAGVMRRSVEDGDGLRTVAEVAVGEPLGAVAPVDPAGAVAPVDSAGAVAPVDSGGPVAPVDPAGGGGWLLAAGRGLRLLRPDGAVEPLLDTEPEGVRMNDAACDPQGRFWAGSMRSASSGPDQRPGGGRLLRCDPDGTVRVALPAATVANGLGWSPDGRTLYHADSGPGVLTAYPVDPGTGELGPGERLVEPEHGVPDGLTVDDEGALWVALHGAGEVRRYAPDGRTLAVIRLPVSQPTSVAIGGASGRRLFVTTAWETLDERRRAAQPDAGRVFAVDDVGVTAPPVRRYRGQLPARLGG